MYSNLGYGPDTPVSNNPFVADPTNAHARFPDINAPSAPFQSTPVGQYASWSAAPAPASPMGYLGQAQSLGSPFAAAPMYPQQQPFDPAFRTQQSMPAPSQPFQPSSAFGQQLISGSSYGYLNGGGGGGTASPTTTSGTGLPFTLAQQQIQNNPGYVAQFDPYSSLGQGWDGSPQSNSNVAPGRQQQQQQQQQQPGPTPSSSGPSGDPHPRTYIRTHKAELDSWDTYAWKQLFNAFGALKDAWSKRADELRALAGQAENQVQYAVASGSFFAGQAQQELVRIQSVGVFSHPFVIQLNRYLLPRADGEGCQLQCRSVCPHSSDRHLGMLTLVSASDSVAASLFQMQEVYAGYRQSGDAASKRRVRESFNAALSSLPEWPQQF